MKLWEHQKQAIAKALEGDHFALFMSVGTGKTRTCIEIIRRVYAKNGKMLPTLIFAPLSVVENWERELLLFSKTGRDDILCLVGDKKPERLRNFLLNKATLQYRPAVVITNYETALQKTAMKTIEAWGPEVLVLDECHRVKNPKAKRSKIIGLLSDSVKYKYILSGTPILNSPADIFMQYRILDSGETFGKNFFAFRAQWFEDLNASWKAKPGYFPKFVPRDEVYSRMNEMIYKKAFRATREECLDLPPLIKQEVHVELSFKQREHYDEMKRDFITWVKDKKRSGEPKAVIARLAMTKVLRLMQIASGFLKTEDGAITEIEDNPRLHALSDLLEDHAQNEKIIVWSIFKENYKHIKRVCENLGLGYVELHGETKAEDRPQIIKRFKEDASCRVFISNPASGGEGINLAESSVSIFYTRDFSLLKDAQAEARNYRGGSEIHKRILRIDLIAKNSVDTMISEAIEQKADIAEKILQWAQKQGGN